MVRAIVLLAFIAVVAAFPADDPVVMRWDTANPRYTYVEDDQGNAHLVDQWLKMSDLEKLARYRPNYSTLYHLFTRDNPSRSQPLQLHNLAGVESSNFDPRKRTIVLMHGFMGSVTSGFNTVLVPAFLAAEDCNVLAMDWSTGSYWGPYAKQAGEAAAVFIDWLNSITGSTPEQYHIVGYSVGGHGAGIIARNVNGNVGYVTGLDPAERWDAAHLFRADDAIYTEVIHTSSMGEEQPMGQVDFYPNKGSNMPGCVSSLCDHLRSYYYLAESLESVFTGRRCENLQQALTGTCNAAGTLRMGGLEPKTGNTGIFYLTTNRQQPFSQG